MSYRAIAVFNNARSALASGNLVDAETGFREVTTLLPFKALGWAALGTVLTYQKKLTEALSSFEKAVSLQPENPLCRRLHGKCLVRTGDLLADTLEYEWPGPVIPQAERWDGRTSLDGRSIVLGAATHGLGDVIQLARCIPLLKKERGASRVLLQLHSPRFQRLSGVIETAALDEVIYHQENGPCKADYYASISSLPHFLKTDSGIPGTVPYLSPSESEIASVRKALAGIGGFKLGLCWQSSRKPDHLEPYRGARSIPSELLGPLMNLDGITVFNLQGGDSRRDSFPGCEAMRDISGDPLTLARDAAIISEMDLIVTVDTSIAHLAGALGKRTWVMLPFFADWRWMEDREDNPWYPTMRLFRQERPGDWSSVIQRVRQALIQRAAEATGRFARESN